MCFAKGYSPKRRWPREAYRLPNLHHYNLLGRVVKIYVVAYFVSKGSTFWLRNGRSNIPHSVVTHYNTVIGTRLPTYGNEEYPKMMDPEARLANKANRPDV